MELFQDLLLPRAKLHDEEVHIKRIKTWEESEDPSCGLCHPPRRKVKMSFWNFWQWYSQYTGAETYSENTIQKFNNQEIMEKSKDKEEVTREVVKLIETMRYPLGIKVKTDDLITTIKRMFKETDRFEGEVEEEGIQNKIPEEDVISIASTLSSILENTEGVEETREFRKFWELFKEQEPRVKSFTKETARIFEEMMEISDETLETIKEQSAEEKERIANIIQRIIRSMKYNGL